MHHKTLPVNGWRGFFVSRLGVWLLLLKLTGGRAALESPQQGESDEVPALRKTSDFSYHRIDRS